MNARPLPALIRCSLRVPLLVALLALASAAPVRGGVSPEARPIVDRLARALGGPTALAECPTLSFGFTYSSRDTVRSSRRHWWDRTSGRYRIEGRGRDGLSFVLLFNVQSKEGDAWIGGRKLEGDERATWLERAYALFINDSYWLLMPYKLEDPGVNVAADGEAVVNGRPCDRLRVTFDNVGLTPGDTYWAYIDRESHRMIRWGFILERDRAASETPTEALYDWPDWRSAGALLLSPRRVRVDDPERTVLTFEPFAAGEPIGDRILTDPAPVEP
jgi:hypothetical protein